METNLTMLHGTSRAWLFAKPMAATLAIVFALMALIFVGVRSAGAEDTPSATIELSGGSVAAGIGYTWGNGTLIFEGKKYPIKVQGLSVVHVGASDYTASGTVYNLKKLSDINGV
jgi:hypothetical protein